MYALFPHHTLDSHFSRARCALISCTYLHTETLAFSYVILVSVWFSKTSCLTHGISVCFGLCKVWRSWPILHGPVGDMITWHQFSRSSPRHQLPRTATVCHYLKIGNQPMTKFKTTWPLSSNTYICFFLLFSFNIDLGFSFVCLHWYKNKNTLTSGVKEHWVSQIISQQWLSLKSSINTESWVIYQHWLSSKLSFNTDRVLRFIYVINIILKVQQPLTAI